MKPVCLLLLVLFFCIVPSVKASNNVQPFSLSGNFTYELTSNGSVKVREEIVIRNVTTETYAPSFSFDTDGFTPTDITVYESGLAAKVIQKDEHTYEATFKRPALGLGANKKVTILFTDESLVTKHGKVVEIKIPRVKNASQFTSLKTVLRVSLDDAQTFHIFPQTTGVKNGSFMEYSLDLSKTSESPVTAYLGDVAAFDFTLNYPFINTSYFPREVTFAIPPDTATQKVYLEQFSDMPESLTYDSDGNWIGKLTLKAKEQKTFTVSGTIFVFASAQDDFPAINQEAIKLNTSPQKYWESNDPQIHELAQRLKTPQAIYDYVVHNLSYDYTKTARPQERLGAKLSLSKKTEAICMEFTDLFIAIARAAGIPAREVNGFAISEDSMRPRALGGDVLHSWPEYYDTVSGQWIQVDPTWGNTTGGVDYFSHFDLNHITFVIHGASSTLPQTPGTYETTDPNSDLIHIEPSAKGVESETTTPTIAVSPVGFSLWSQTYTVTVENSSGHALYNIPVSVQADNTNIVTKNIPSILPYSKSSFSINLYPGFFGSKLPARLQIESLKETIEIPVSKTAILIAHLFVLMMPIVLLPIMIYFIAKHAKH